MFPRIGIFSWNKIRCYPFKHTGGETMKCSKSKLASPYVDGELNDRERALFEDHARLCPVCGARVAGYRSLRTGFHDAAEYRAPLGFSTRVRARIAEDRRSGSFGFPFLVRFAEGAVISLLVTMGIISGSFLVNGAQQQGAGGMTAAFSLDVFEPAPPDSVGGVYLAMTEAGYEK